MKLTWNLEDLFKSNKDFYNEIENIEKLLYSIKKYENEELNEESFFDMLREKWNIIC